MAMIGTVGVFEEHTTYKTHRSKFQINIYSVESTLQHQPFVVSRVPGAQSPTGVGGLVVSAATAIINPISSPGKGTKMYEAEICKIVQDCTYKMAPGTSCFMGFMPPGVANLHQTPFDTKSFLSKRLLSCNGKYHRSKMYHLSCTALLQNATKIFAGKLNSLTDFMLYLFI